VSCALLFLALAVATPEAGRVLVMDLEGVGVDAADADAATRVVAAAAAEVEGVNVMSAADIRRLAALEADRLNAGCEQDASCLAEIAGAMGAEQVLFGSLSRLGSTTTVILSLYDARTTMVTRRSFDVTDAGALPRLLRASTSELIGGEVEAPPAPVVGSGPSVGAITLGVGLGVVVVGGAAAGLAELMVQDPDGNGDAKADWQNVGLLALGGAALGLVVAGVGGALIAGGL
jgi:hypothetical protein